MSKRTEWIIRAGKNLVLGTGALASMAFLTGCPPPEEPPPPAPEEQPPPTPE